MLLPKLISPPFLHLKNAMFGFLVRILRTILFCCLAWNTFFLDPGRIIGHFLRNIFPAILAKDILFRWRLRRSFLLPTCPFQPTHSTFVPRVQEGGSRGEGDLGGAEGRYHNEKNVTSPQNRANGMRFPLFSLCSVPEITTINDFLSESCKE